MNSSYRVFLSELADNKVFSCSIVVGHKEHVYIAPSPVLGGILSFLPTPVLGGIFVLFTHLHADVPHPL